MRIGLDLDGVCYPWDVHVRRMLSYEFGYRDLPEPTHWDSLKEAISDAQWMWLWTRGVEQGMFRDGGMYAGARGAAESLCGMGEVVIITHRPLAAQQDTIDWLAFHHVPYNELHIMNKGAKSQVPCDIYIDDGPHVAEDLLANTPAKVVLWDRLYNQEFHSDDPRLVRVNNWTNALIQVELAL